MSMTMAEYLQRQMQEALSDENKWHCSRHYGYEVRDPEKLLAYYIKHGGATHFCQAHMSEVEDRKG